MLAAALEEYDPEQQNWRTPIHHWRAKSGNSENCCPQCNKNSHPHRHRREEFRECCPLRQLMKFLGDMEVSMDNALASGRERTVCDTPDRVVFRTADPTPRPTRGERSRRKVNWKRPFINLSSTAAFVRRLFALNEGIAAIEVNKIHIDPLPPEQKVGSSNRGGAAAPRNSDPQRLRRLAVPNRNTHGLERRALLRSRWFKKGQKWRAD